MRGCRSVARSFGSSVHGRPAAVRSAKGFGSSTSGPVRSFGSRKASVFRLRLGHRPLGCGRLRPPDPSRSVVFTRRGRLRPPGSRQVERSLGRRKLRLPDSRPVGSRNPRSRACLRGGFSLRREVSGRQRSSGAFGRRQGSASVVSCRSCRAWPEPRTESHALRHLLGGDMEQPRSGPRPRKWCGAPSSRCAPASAGSQNEAQRVRAIVISAAHDLRAAQRRDGHSRTALSGAGKRCAVIPLCRYPRASVHGIRRAELVDFSPLVGTGSSRLPASAGRRGCSPAAPLSDTSVPVWACQCSRTAGHQRVLTMSLDTERSLGSSGRKRSTTNGLPGGPRRSLLLHVTKAFRNCDLRVVRVARWTPCGDCMSTRPSLASLRRRGRWGSERLTQRAPPSGGARRVRACGA